jgi:hypothetical protein
VGVRWNSGLFSATTNRILVYSSSRNQSGATGSKELVWMDREGKIINTASPTGDYQNFRLSGDEKKII